MPNPTPWPPPVARHAAIKHANVEQAVFLNKWARRRSGGLGACPPRTGIVGNNQLVDRAGRLHCGIQIRIRVAGPFRRNRGNDAPLANAFAAPGRGIRNRKAKTRKGARGVLTKNDM